MKFIIVIDWKTQLYHTIKPINVPLYKERTNKFLFEALTVNLAFFVAVERLLIPYFLIRFISKIDEKEQFYFTFAVIIERVDVQSHFVFTIESFEHLTVFTEWLCDMLIQVMLLLVTELHLERLVLNIIVHKVVIQINRTKLLCLSKVLILIMISNTIINKVFRNKHIIL